MAALDSLLRTEAWAAALDRHGAAARLTATVYDRSKDLSLAPFDRRRSSKRLPREDRPCSSNAFNSAWSRMGSPRSSGQETPVGNYFNAHSDCVSPSSPKGPCLL